MDTTATNTLRTEQPSSPAGVRWWSMMPEAVAHRLGTDLTQGLGAPEASRRLEAGGPNDLVREERVSPLRMFLGQFANTMIVVLLVAAVITAALGEVRDTFVIVGIVLLNAAIGFIQEYRAEQALTALRDMAAPFARVVRGGTIRDLPAVQLVPGDLIRLEVGDIVPADGRVIESTNLRVDEAALTGESLPVDKSVERLTASDEPPIPDRTNMVFKGTPVVHGRGRAVVVATGMQTELGAIASMLHRHRAPATPLQRRLATLGRLLAIAAVVIASVIFAVGIARGEPATLMFLTSVSLAVAAIPEALPAVVTIALALGAKRLVARHALIRKLPAVETLGSVTVICTDKTGTLTQAVMQVERVWTPHAEYSVAGTGYQPSGNVEVLTGDTEADDKLAALLETAVLCNDASLIPPEAGGAWTVIGDPTEGALLALAERGRYSVQQLRAGRPRVSEIPFDSERKLMTTVHRAAPSEVLIATKGAPESVLRITLGVEQTAALDKAEEYAAAGYRVLAFAGKRVPVGALQSTIAEDALQLYGLVAMGDPLREESVAAVTTCRSAGMTPVMITGDHPATARAIAEQLGILEGREVMTGDELAAAGRTLIDRVEDVAVYARVSPEQKLNIVEAWNRRGQVVAMTGDGVNDAPALRRADIGVAMGVSGTDVSKEAADMVLTDDNFASIVAAVEEGRRVYDNVRRFIRYTLTSNSGEIWVMFLAPFVGLPLPLLPVHILWINLVTDGLPGLALGVEPSERDVMRRPPRPPTESVFARGLWQHLLLVGLLMGIVPLAIGLWSYNGDGPWRTMIFSSLALLQLGHALAVRSETLSLFSLGITTNKSLLGAVCGTLLLQLVVIYWPPAQLLLHTEALSGRQLLVVLFSSTLVFWAVEAEKLWRRRRAVSGGP